MTLPPLLGYIHKHAHRTQGSGYKYYHFIRSYYGGLITGSITSLEPDLVFVRGDTLDDYLEPKSLGIPYIAIEQDCMSLRQGIAPFELELDRIENASGMIFNTRTIAQHYINHGVKLPPWIVVPLMPLKSDLVFVPPEKLYRNNTLVYAGNVVPWQKRSDVYGYKALHDVFKLFMNAGWEVHAYLNATKSTQVSSGEIAQLGVIVHDWLPYPKLLQEIHQYDVGLHAFNNTDISPTALAYGHSALANKCWDYLAAGIPTVAYNVGREAKSVYEGKWGIVIRDGDSIKPADLLYRTWRTLPVEFTTNPLMSYYRLTNVIDNYLGDVDKLIAIALKESRELCGTKPLST